MSSGGVFPPVWYLSASFAFTMFSVWTRRAPSSPPMVGISNIVKIWSSVAAPISVKNFAAVTFSGSVANWTEFAEKTIRFPYPNSRSVKSTFENACESRRKNGAISPL